MLLGEILHKSALNYPTKDALVGAKHRLTYMEMDEETNKIANSLRKLGLKKGDRVGILSKNCVEYMEVYYAVAKLGCILVPINWRLEQEELEFILKDSIPRALFYSSDYREVVQRWRNSSNTVEIYIGVDSRENGTLSFKDLLSDGEISQPNVNIAPDDIVIQFYTGGTTATPKGVLWSHRTLHYHCLNLCLGWEWSPDIVGLVVLPVFHQMGAHTLAMQYIGGTSVILPEFDPVSVLETIERERITRMILVPTTIIMLIEHPDFKKYDISSLQNIQYGGAPMPVGPLKKAREMLGCEFRQSYGMTEAPLVTALNPDDHVLDGTEEKHKRLHSVGRPMPDVVGINIVNDEGKLLTSGEVGEIVVKQPSQMLGYWNLKEETEKTIRNGWIYTGDLGYLDQDGYLYLTERKKDIIITGGENVSAKEIEEILYTHPAVLEATVVGSPHDLWGEAVTAVIFLREGMTANEQEIIKYCKKSLASYKVPKKVDFISEPLPKSAIGKILKREVRKRYWPQ